MLRLQIACRMKCRTSDTIWIYHTGRFLQLIFTFLNLRCFAEYKVCIFWTLYSFLNSLVITASIATDVVRSTARSPTLTRTEIEELHEMDI